MLNRSFDEISKADIDALIENEVSEGKCLEYKRDLPGIRDQDKIEFLADVSSFANRSGGHIIYGLGDKQGDDDQNTGIPEYVGLGGINVEGDKLRLEQMVLSGIDPRIPGLEVKEIEGFENGPVLLMKIPKSWVGPHMVTLKNCSRFFSRSSAGKYQLDVGEIRAAYAASEALPERVRQFRRDRVGKILTGETPIRICEGPKILLHMVPMEAMSGESKGGINIAGVKHTELPPIYSTEQTHRYNFDGLLIFDHFGDRSSGYCYVQLFRNGIIEALDAWIIGASGEDRAISRGYEESIVTALKTYLGFMERLGVTPPVVVMLSLLGVKGFVIGGVNSQYARRRQDPIDREHLIVPEVVVEMFDAEPEVFMKPIFDAVWNAAGWPRSMNYDKNGNWKR